jgi:hypothetical protein
MHVRNGSIVQTQPRFSKLQMSGTAWSCCWWVLVVRLRLEYWVEEYPRSSSKSLMLLSITIAQYNNSKRERTFLVKIVFY